MTEKRNFDAEIQEQLEIIRKANERVGELVKERGGWVPVFPDLPQYPSFPVFPGTPIFPSFGEVSCSECGLKWSGPMGYVCTNSKCPSAVTCSSTK